jgi:hypothetical protein
MMEGIKPEAVRLSNGTELYISPEEAERPFVSPTDEAKFVAQTELMNSVEAQIHTRFRLAAMLSVPQQVRFSGNEYRWIRETTA